MTDWHVELINPDQSRTYLGVVSDAHVEEVRSIADLDESPRWAKPHPDTDDEFFVIRDDGLLDHYVVEGAEQRPRVSEAFAAPAEAPHLMGGLKGPAYIPGVERLGDQSIGGAMDYPGNPPRCVQHTTESGQGSGAFTSVASYLIQVASEPQVLYDPVSDRLGQFGPLNLSGRALKNEASGRRTNREGLVCIQVEVLGRAANPWTTGWDPVRKPNWQKFAAACAAWGISDAWPNGAPVKYPPGYKNRSTSNWHNGNGTFGHQDVPGNDHGDPGAISTVKVKFSPWASGGGGSTPARYKTKINGLEYGYGATGPQVTLVGKKLVEKGFGKHYTNGPGPTWSDSDTLNYADFQKSLGLSGDAADGVPGEGSLKKLLGYIPSPADFQVKEYTVKLGDTLYSIAKKYKTTVEKLKAKNGLKSDELSIGQKLKIPTG